MDKQAREAKEQTKNLPFKKKVENFWFYYKKHTVISIFVFVVLTVTTVQCMRETDYDLEIALYNRLGVAQVRLDEIAEILKEQSYDLNENGAVDILVNQYVYNTERQYLNEEGIALLQKLQLEIAANDYPVYLADEAYMKRITTGYAEVVDEVLDLKKVPDVRERLNLGEEDTLYWIKLVEYESSKNNEKLMARYKLVEHITEYLKANIEK